MSETKEVWNVFFSGKDGGFDNYIYRPTPEQAAVLSDYRDFLTEVFRAFKVLARVHAVVTANWAYFAERELASAVVACGVPFLALHKESVRSKAERSFYEQAYAEYSGRFGGTAIAVYNEFERQIVASSGVAELHQIAVVGCPRMDALHRLREGSGLRAEEPGRRPLAVLFFVSPLSGTLTPLDRFHESPPGPRWVQLSRDLLTEFVRIARSDPGSDYIIKSKGDLAAAVADVFGPDPVLPSNLALLDGGVELDLAWQADVAVAFNSTVVFECVAAGTHLIVPKFAEAADPAHDAWIIPVLPSATIATSLDEFSEALRNHLALRDRRPRPLSPEEVHYLDRHVGNPDGRSGERAYRFLSQYVPTLTS